LRDDETLGYHVSIYTTKTALTLPEWASKGILFSAICSALRFHAAAPQFTMLLLPSAIERAPMLPSGMRSDSLGVQPDIFSRRRRIESLCFQHFQIHAMGLEVQLTTHQ
jgi:hypothetical protein